jgi:hypothetical protein
MTSAKWVASGLIALSLGGLGGAPAWADGALPAVERIHGIEVLSGGVGRDEARALQGEARHWPLALEFAVKEPKVTNGAEFAADVAVHIRDAHGRGVLDTTADGPFLLARLAPGTYRVDASLDGHALHRDVRVEAGHTSQVLLLWPQGVDGPRT